MDNKAQIMSELQRMKQCMDNIVRMLNVNNVQRSTQEAPVHTQSDGPYTGNTPMPFGKFTGKPLKSLPKAYIDWLYKTNVTDSKLAEYVASRTMEIEKPEQGEFLQSEQDDVPY